MKTTTGCSADYTAGFDAGYKSGFAAGRESVAGSKPVYQGRDTLCASCGKPVGDSPVQKQEYEHIFLYCSTQCRDYHAVGA
jgi:hypothetical protein